MAIGISLLPPHRLSFSSYSWSDSKTKKHLIAIYSQHGKSSAKLEPGLGQGSPSIHLRPYQPIAMTITRDTTGSSKNLDFTRPLSL